MTRLDYDEDFEEEGAAKVNTEVAMNLSLLILFYSNVYYKGIFSFDFSALLFFIKYLSYLCVDRF